MTHLGTVMNEVFALFSTLTTNAHVAPVLAQTPVGGAVHQYVSHGHHPTRSTKNNMSVVRGHHSSLQYFLHEMKFSCRVGTTHAGP